MSVTKAQRITQLMNSRRGKKSSITKRITQIDRIVEDGGSRSQVIFLISALEKVQQALQTVCDELVTLDPDTDSEWLDTENLRIDTCISEAKAYLERRRDDPPSTEGLADSWVKKHAFDGTDSKLTDTVSEVTQQLEGLSTHQHTIPKQQDYLKPAHLSWQGSNTGILVPSQQRFVNTNNGDIC